MREKKGERVNEKNEVITKEKRKGRKQERGKNEKKEGNMEKGKRDKRGRRQENSERLTTASDVSFEFRLIAMIFALTPS